LSSSLFHTAAYKCFLFEQIYSDDDDDKILLLNKGYLINSKPTIAYSFITT